jgi:hypothetical protein
MVDVNMYQVARSSIMEIIFHNNYGLLGEGGLIIFDVNGNPPNIG